MASLSRRSEARTARRAEVEAAVLRATEELLAGGSAYADLNVERIAQAAGISRTAFYFYFRDKRELLMRLTDDLAGVLYQEADHWWSGASEGGPEALREALGRIIAIFRDHGALLRAVVAASSYDEPVAEFWRSLAGRFVEATRARIVSEQGAGNTPPAPASATAFALVWMTERVCYEQVVQGRPLDERELEEGIVTVWLRTIYPAATGP